MSKKDYILEINPNAERRFFAPKLELRADGDSRKVIGYAAVFNSNSEDFGGWIERIDPKAFDDVLNDDAVALLNHDINYIFARNKVTMTLSVDDVGLKYEFDAPNTTAGNDLIENLRLGNIKQSSFGFSVASQKWDYAQKDTDPSIRTIMKVGRLYDVSPVTYPAYPETTVALRSFKQLLDENEASAKKNLIEVIKKRNQLRKLRLQLDAA